MIQTKPATKEAWDLFHRANLAFCDIEQNGIRIDVEYCIKSISTLEKKLKVLKDKLENHEITKRWKSKYKHKFNLNSGKQMADVLFMEMGIDPPKVTDKGNYQTDADALERLEGVENIDNFIHYRRLYACRNTFLKNILAEQVNGIMHPFFHLNNIISYRSSSSNINFQNQPTRNPEQKRIVRKAFIPREHHLLGEIDFSGAEVRVSSCYHKDENMIADILDLHRDMHRDMAMECFKLSNDEWTKQIRQEVKGDFVFAEFYGSYFKQVAQALWDDIKLRKLTTKQGIGLYDHLKKKGIKNYEAFEKHIQKVEDRFWHERYPKYTEWKERFYNRYQAKGYFALKTGFICSGYMVRNAVLNYPVQGSSFHCLLKVMVELHEWLAKERMDTQICGQIHDSIILDIHPDEYSLVLNKATYLIEELQQEWKWLIIPMKAEIEICIMNAPWNAKQEVYKTECICPTCNIDRLYLCKDIDYEAYECPLCGERITP